MNIYVRSIRNNNSSSSSSSNNNNNNNNIKSNSNNKKIFNKCNSSRGNDITEQLLQ